MFKSKIARVFTLGAGATIAVLLAFGASQAQAATGPQMTYVPQYQFNAGVGRCFLPQNAFGGSGPYMTLPNVTFRNDYAATITVREYLWIFNLNTGTSIGYRWAGDFTVGQGGTVSIPAAAINLPSRSPSNMYSIVGKVDLELIYNGGTFAAWIGSPSYYNMYTTGSPGQSFQGTQSFC